MKTVKLKPSGKEKEKKRPAPKKTHTITQSGAVPYLVEKGEIDKLMQSPSIYKCLSCYACVERCPRGVEPAKIVEAVRLQVIRQAGKNHLTPDDIPALLDEDLPQQAIVTAMRKYSK